MMKHIIQKRDQKLHFSPLRYPGGKSFFFPLFAAVIKENALKDVSYIEPFAGGAGAALVLLLEGKVKNIVINDLDKGIYSFWKSAIFESLKFIRKMYRTPVTIHEWKKQRKIYANPSARRSELGFATFFLNRTNISGILDGGPIGGLDQKGKWKIDSRFNKKTLAVRIRSIARYKDKILVSRQDGIAVIRKYLKAKNTFIYLDPPYYEKGAALYLNHYKKADHENLAEYLNNHPNAFWLLTYDNKRQIKSLYPKRKISNFSLNYNAYKARVGKEILISSDALKVQVK